MTESTLPDPGKGVYLAYPLTVFPDDNKKYLTTDLLKDEPAKEGFLSPDVELLRFSSYKRVCMTCCDPGDCAQAWSKEKRLDEIEHLSACPLRDDHAGA